MNKVTVLEKNELAKWDHFVYHHREGTIYQTSLWRKIIRESFGHQPLYLVIKNAAGEIEAGMPFFKIQSKAFGNRLTALPCAQACNPLAADTEKHGSILKFVQDYVKQQNIPYAELKTSSPLSPGSDIAGNSFTGYSTYILDLSPGLEPIENSFHKNCIRRAIKKAQKSGLELVVGNSMEDVKIFYDLYLKMRKEYGLLPQPFRFFERMWKVLNIQGYSEILHAKYQDEIISSLILIKYKDTAIYEYGASRSDMVHLSPSPFLLWEAIRRAKEQGYTQFDFGRTDNDNEGLSTFKKRWNTRQEALHYYYLPDVGGFSAMRQKGLAKQVMYHTIRHSPESLCQLMGQLLYKNFV